MVTPAAVAPLCLYAIDADIFRHAILMPIRLCRGCCFFFDISRQVMRCRQRRHAAVFAATLMMSPHDAAAIAFRAAATMFFMPYMLPYICLLCCLLPDYAMPPCAADMLDDTPYH